MVRKKTGPLVVHGSRQMEPSSRGNENNSSIPKNETEINESIPRRPQESDYTFACVLRPVKALKNDPGRFTACCTKLRRIESGPGGSGGRVMRP